MKNKFKIFVDLDEVLVNFNKRFSQLYELPDIEYVKKYGKDSFDTIVRNFIPEYWEYLEWMRDGKYLWDNIKQYNPIILSAHLHSPNTIIGKERWLNRELPNIQYYIVEIKTKHLYAASEYILIDDNKNNIKDWINAGGIGILHTSADTSLEKLNSILQNSEELSDEKNIY